jgi:hypothetical protein
MKGLIMERKGIFNKMSIAMALIGLLLLLSALPLSLADQLQPPDNVCPISPIGLISTHTPTFVWTAVPTATKYLLQIENQDRIIFKGSYMAENVTVGYKCEVFSPLLLPDGDLFWRVQASNDAGSGPMSGYAWFESVCGGKKKKDLAKEKRARKPASMISIPYVFAA